MERSQLNHRDAAVLSKQLVILRTDVPVALDLDKLRRRPPDRAAANALFTELEFVALAKEYAPEAGPSRTVSEVLTEPDALGAAVRWLERASGRRSTMPSAPANASARGAASGTLANSLGNGWTTRTGCPPPNAMMPAATVRAGRRA